MKNMLRLPFLALLCLAGAAVHAAESLDFPTASFRIKIGAQSTVTPATAGSEVQMGGRTVRVGERMSNSVRINWIIAPSPEIGDEYVFFVRRAKEKPRTYSVIFKGAYTSVIEQEGFLIEIEN